MAGKSRVCDISERRLVPDFKRNPPGITRIYEYTPPPPRPPPPINGLATALPEYITPQKNITCIYIMKLTDIERTRLSFEISHTRTDLTLELSCQSIGLANQRSRVRLPP